MKRLLITLPLLVAAAPAQDGLRAIALRQHAAARLKRPRFRNAVPRLLRVSAEWPSSSSARR